MGGFIQPIFFARSRSRVAPPVRQTGTKAAHTSGSYQWHWRQGRSVNTMNWQAAVERTVTALGYDLVDTERSVGGLLRVYIDRLPGRAYDSGPGETITVADCEVVTRQLQYALEVDAVDYARLEVSSPGLDRPLRKPADWQRFTGAEVEVTLRQAFNNRKRWRGELAAREGGWRLVLRDGKEEQAFDFALEEVREARLVPVVDFKRRAPASEAMNDGGQDR